MERIIIEVKQPIWESLYENTGYVVIIGKDVLKVKFKPIVNDNKPSLHYILYNEKSTLGEFDYEEFDSMEDVKERIEEIYRDSLVMNISKSILGGFESIEVD